MSSVCFVTRGRRPPVGGLKGGEVPLGSYGRNKSKQDVWGVTGGVFPLQAYIFGVQAWLIEYIIHNCEFAWVVRGRICESTLFYGVLNRLVDNHVFGPRGIGFAGA